MVAQIAAGDPPDLGLFAESQLPMMIANGYLVDVSDVVASLDDEAYFKNTWKGTAYRDGKYYGIPPGVYHMVMYYNKDLFDKAGLPYPSAKWDDSLTL